MRGARAARQLLAAGHDDDDTTAATAATATTAAATAAAPPPRRVVPLGSVDVGALRAAMLERWGELWGGAHHFTHLFPGLANYGSTFRGVENVKLLFSASPASLRGSDLGRRAPVSAFSALPWPQTERWRVVFPAWNLLRSVVLPVFDELFGRRLQLPRYLSHILRVQMNRMPAGANIAPHADRGFYATGAHRYHVPILVPRCVRFAHAREVGGGGGDGGGGGGGGGGGSGSLGVVACGTCRR